MLLIAGKCYLFIKEHATKFGVAITTFINRCEEKLEKFFSVSLLLELRCILFNTQIRTLLTV